MSGRFPNNHEIEAVMREHGVGLITALNHLRGRRAAQEALERQRRREWLMAQGRGGA